jgi:hypothetical protein
MQYLTPNPFRTGYDFHKSTHNRNALNTLPPKVPGGRPPNAAKSKNSTISIRIHYHRKRTSCPKDQYA